MSHPNKRRGTDLERWVVREARNHNLDAKRMWGSDGRSRGLKKEVDVLVCADIDHVYELQCKNTKTLAKKYKPIEGIDGQVFAEDRGEKMIMIRLKDYFRLIANQA